MIVALGEQVVGKNGALGKIAGFRMDPNSQSADQMVIKHGLPFHNGHFAVLGFVTDVETGVVRVNLSKQELEELEQHSKSAFRSDDLKPGPIPPFSSQGEDLYKHPGNVPFASPNPSVSPEHSRERFNNTRPMPPEYPAETSVAPDDEQPIVITKGTGVWDNTGVRVGHVRTFAVETSTGQPTEITAEGGVFGREGCRLEMNWVERFGTSGIVLKVSKDQVSACK